MNRRGKRLTLGMMAVGLGVVLVLAIVNWRIVRDHVEAWHFQLTRETRTEEPDLVSQRALADLTVSYIFRGSARTSPGPGGAQGLAECLYRPSHFFLALVRQSGCPVILASKHDFDRPSITLASPFQNVTTDTIRAVLQANDFRVLEQRFPRRAYVVIHDQGATP